MIQKKHRLKFVHKNIDGAQLKFMETGVSADFFLRDIFYKILFMFLDQKGRGEPFFENLTKNYCSSPPHEFPLF